MYAKMYFDLENKHDRMNMVDEIKENETEIFDDIKDIVKSYIKNNINQKSLDI